MITGLNESVELSNPNSNSILLEDLLTIAGQPNDISRISWNEPAEGMSLAPENTSKNSKGSQNNLSSSN